MSRKGDEGKPRCQNCIAKQFECRYPAQFQILGKNNFTPRVPAEMGYQTLRFIPEAGEESAEVRNKAKDNPETDVEARSRALLKPASTERQSSASLTERDARDSEIPSTLSSTETDECALPVRTEPGVVNDAAGSISSVTSREETPLFVPGHEPKMAEMRLGQVHFADQPFGDIENIENPWEEFVPSSGTKRHQIVS
ncbi:hypothetical protein BCR34DRAFT_608438 [Clohesyomyces aquaticus]|uniref:Zn(2)-C6 fungal-type domain-containing protein n=1 Tax=Clohesyomyces aquaticus TaxID=1231657 RepID=A0A1Y1Y851_9PLEO|nr:hypothetical protein BCR34DRAFT_608438 [Clohesyomyces aquaticus]